MIKYLLIITFALSTSLHAQVVNIPDANFKTALLTHNPLIDLNKDNEIQVSEAIVVLDLNVSSKSISDLTGIEYFTGLKSLSCTNNQLTNLDLSKNTNLNSLNCYVNNLTKLDVSKNLLLDLLYCYSNKLSLIDVSSNQDLRGFGCSLNLLTSLDVRKNTKLSKFECKNNPSLSIICISDLQTSNSKYWVKDGLAEWSTTCGTITGIEERLNEPTQKTLTKILTTLGQEIQLEQANDGLFIYQYSDGSTKKIAK